MYHWKQLLFQNEENYSVKGGDLTHLIQGLGGFSQLGIAQERSQKLE